MNCLLRSGICDDSSNSSLQERQGPIRSDQSNGLCDVGRTTTHDIENGTRWLTLDAYYQWEQAVPIGQDPSDSRRKQFWYILHSYVVRRKDIDELFEWGKTQDAFDQWMPESHGLHEVFLVEFFWSPAYQYFNVPYYHCGGWTRGYDERISRELLLSAEECTRDDQGLDCSMDEGYSIYLPTKRIADGIDLRWNGVEGHFLCERESSSLRSLCNAKGTKCIAS
jgi:hypothetical protein